MISAGRRCAVQAERADSASPIERQSLLDGHASGIRLDESEGDVLGAITGSKSHDEEICLAGVRHEVLLAREQVAVAFGLPAKLHAFQREIVILFEHRHTADHRTVCNPRQPASLLLCATGIENRSARKRRGDQRGREE